MRAISTTSRRELSSSSFFFSARQTPKEIHAILAKILACFLPGRARDLSVYLYTPWYQKTLPLRFSFHPVLHEMLIFHFISSFPLKTFPPKIFARLCFSRLHIHKRRYLHGPDVRRLITQFVKCFVMQHRVKQARWVAGTGSRKCLNIVVRTTEK